MAKALTRSILRDASQSKSAVADFDKPDFDAMLLRMRPVFGPKHRTDPAR